MKHRWIGKVAPEAIPTDELAALARLVLPGIDPKQLRPLTGGFRNWNYRVDTPLRSYVLRVYARGERAAWKEQRVAELVAPEVATPRYVDVHEMGDRVVALREFVEGNALHELIQAGMVVSSGVGREAGRTLAAIHRIEFNEFGELDENLNIGERYDVSGAGVTEYVRRTLAATACGERLGTALTHELLQTLDASSQLLDGWRDRPVLAHGDFGPTNLVLGSDGNLRVLDWEFACSGTPALDFGNLLRPPLADNDGFAEGVATGYRAAGGVLPENWRRLAVLADVVAWVSFAARPQIHELVLADARDRIEHAVREFAT